MKTNAANHSEARLPQELKDMVKWSVTVLGKVIEEKLGKASFLRIEEVRKKMASIRGADHADVGRALEKTRMILSRLNQDEKRDFAKAYTLMLELMNACENAYRTDRLKKKSLRSIDSGAEAIYFVLTAHPTEARAPENIAIFHEIQKLLTESIQFGFDQNHEKLKSLLEVAWNTEMVRMRKPKVQDEAEHIYSILLRDANLSVLLDYGRVHSPVYIRSWVGGDKDGHPGVDEVVMTDSLQMSRTILLGYAKKTLKEYGILVAPIHSKTVSESVRNLSANLKKISVLKTGDAKRVRKNHAQLSELIQIHRREVGSSLPEPLARLEQLFKVFPGLVVPLELREDSGVLMSDPTGNRLAIGKMLKRIGQFAQGDDPCLYARGMIISMAQSLEHIRVAGKMVQKQIGNSKIPIVPLFEQKEALEMGAEIIRNLLQDSKIKKIVQKEWGNVVEVMVGYSDSAKEAGVLSSRLAILDSIVAIEKVCKKAGVKAVFFHGSGGSVDRGGGAIRDQIAGWPQNALNVYKATVQGEMVERTFASPEILRSQISQISENTSIVFNKNQRYQKWKVLDSFAERARNQYQEMIQSTDFLKVVELATPYSYLSALKIGSRPTKRATAELKVSSLRAIPWVLCWTQTRILFPTWWGVGHSWFQTSSTEKKKIKEAFEEHPVFRSYLHALGFTLAKIELPVFEFYLRQSDLAEDLVQKMIQAFQSELAKTRTFFKEVTGSDDPMWFRPWLGESIELRAPMIHPLNILEVMAQKEKDLQLLRLTVTGIASGMLTTG